MVIKFYKKLLLALVLLVPMQMSATEVLNPTGEALTLNCGLSYWGRGVVYGSLLYGNYFADNKIAEYEQALNKIKICTKLKASNGEYDTSSFVDSSGKTVQCPSSKEMASEFNNIVSTVPYLGLKWKDVQYYSSKAVLALAALDAAYQAKQLWDLCSFGVKLREDLNMQGDTQTCDPTKRTQWANYTSARALIAAYNGSTEEQKKAMQTQIMKDINLDAHTNKKEAVDKHLKPALEVLEKELVNYTRHTNIVEKAAQFVTSEPETTQDAFLKGNWLLLNDIMAYEDDILKEYASYSALGSTFLLSMSFKKGCYLRRPVLYSITYYLASRCALRTVAQYARIKAAIAILNNETVTRSRGGNHYHYH